MTTYFDMGKNLVRDKFEIIPLTPPDPELLKLGEWYDTRKILTCVGWVSSGKDVGFMATFEDGKCVGAVKLKFAGENGPKSVT